MVLVAGESALLVDPSEIPSGGDVGCLGRALAARPQGERDEMMANLAACSGLRWGELTALAIPQVDEAGRVKRAAPKAFGCSSSEGTSGQGFCRTAG
jgi:hypothetical protein